MARLSEMIVLITGAGSGIGRATATHLARQGATLALVDVNEDGLAGTDEAIGSLGLGTRTVRLPADVTQSEQVERYVAATVQAFGRIDGFFNNAGIEARPALVEDFAPDELARLVNVNLFGAFHGLHHVLRVMREQGGGAIVNMASVTGLQGQGRQAGYAATKHAIVGLTRTAALDYGRFGVRVNAVAPGAILTPMAIRALRGAAGDDWESLVPLVAEPNPMRRVGQPEDVAGPVGFLLSDEAAYINGVVLTIDGGMSVGEQA